MVLGKRSVAVLPIYLTENSKPDSFLQSITYDTSITNTANRIEIVKTKAMEGSTVERSKKKALF